jgi:hypothetical protein
MTGMLDAIGLPAALPGARCRGKQHLYAGPAPGENPATADARHKQALTLCARCPAIERCPRWHPPGIAAPKIPGRSLGRSPKRK